MEREAAQERWPLKITHSALQPNSSSTHIESHGRETLQPTETSQAGSHSVIRTCGPLASGSESLKGSEPMEKLFMERWFLGLLAKCHRGDTPTQDGERTEKRAVTLAWPTPRQRCNVVFLNFCIFKGNTCPLCKSQRKEVVHTQTTLREHWYFLGKHFHSWNRMSMQTSISFSCSFLPHYVISSII